MRNLQIIQFGDGTYGVRTRSFWPMLWRYLDNDGVHTWSDYSNIRRYCRVDTLAEAKEVKASSVTKVKVIREEQL